MKNIFFSAIVMLGILSAASVCAQGILVYNGTNITARWQNDGGFNGESVITITLSNSAANFATNGQDFIVLGYITPTNVPYGLTATATRTATNKLTVGLSGFAGTNGPSANTANLAFIFNNGAFSNGTASTITGYNGTNLISVCFLPFAPSNWYVNATSGSDATGNGSSGSPWRSITNALKHAQKSANDVLHIASGTYIQPQIGMTNIVTLLGSNPATTIVEPAAQPGAVTNTSVFYYSSALPGIYANLTIQNGQAPVGAGIYESATVGSGVSPDLIVTNCLFLNNSATNGNGGAIDSLPTTASLSVILANCVFSNNVATNLAGTAFGGAVYTAGETLYVSNCVFEWNSASTNGGALYGNVSVLANTLFANNNSAFGSGGAVYTPAAGGRPVSIVGCTFANNTAGTGTPGSGNTVYGGGGLFCGGNSTLGITNSTFYGNSATKGIGGAYYYFSNASGTSNVLYNSTFFSNTAWTNGGAIYVYGSPVFFSCVVASNSIGVGTGPDIYVTATAWVTNSLFGITNGVGAATTLSGASQSVANSFGNFGGNLASPANPGLSTLAWNGGQQPTCALQTNSVAIHAGINPLGLTYDERGAPYARTVAGQTDIGAYTINPPFGTTFSFQ